MLSKPPGSFAGSSDNVFSADIVAMKKEAQKGSVRCSTHAFSWINRSVVAGQPWTRWTSASEEKLQLSLKWTPEQKNGSNEPDQGSEENVCAERHAAARRHRGGLRRSPSRPARNWESCLNMFPVFSANVNWFHYLHQGSLYICHDIK